MAMNVRRLSLSTTPTAVLSSSVYKRATIIPQGATGVTLYLHPLSTGTTSNGARINTSLGPTVIDVGSGENFYMYTGSSTYDVDVIEQD